MVKKKRFFVGDDDSVIGELRSAVDCFRTLGERLGEAELNLSRANRRR